MEILFTSQFVRTEIILLIIIGLFIASLFFTQFIEFIRRLVQIFWPRKRDAKLVDRAAELLKKREKNAKKISKSTENPAPISPTDSTAIVPTSTDTSIEHDRLKDWEYAHSEEIYSDDIAMIQAESISHKNTSQEPINPYIHTPNPYDYEEKNTTLDIQTPDHEIYRKEVQAEVEALLGTSEENNEETVSIEKKEISKIPEGSKIPEDNEEIDEIIESNHGLHDASNDTSEEVWERFDEDSLQNIQREQRTQFSEQKNSLFSKIIQKFKKEWALRNERIQEEWENISEVDDDTYKDRVYTTDWFEGDIVQEPTTEEIDTQNSDENNDFEIIREHENIVPEDENTSNKEIISEETPIKDNNEQSKNQDWENEATIQEKVVEKIDDTWDISSSVSEDVVLEEGDTSKEETLVWEDSPIKNQELRVHWWASSDTDTSNEVHSSDNTSKSKQPITEETSWSIASVAKDEENKEWQPSTEIQEEGRESSHKESIKSKKSNKKDIFSGMSPEEIEAKKNEIVREKSLEKKFGKKNSSEKESSKWSHISSETVETLEGEIPKKTSEKSAEARNIEKLFEITSQVRTYIARGMITEARAAIIQGLALKKNHRELNMILAELYENDKEFDKAELIYKDLAEIHTEDTEVLKHLANILIIKKRYPVAHALYKKILALGSDDENSLYMLSYISAELADFSDVYQYSKQYIKQWPNNKEILSLLSESQIVLGKRKEAISTLIKLKNLSPYDASEIEQYIEKLTTEVELAENFSQHNN